MAQFHKVVNAFQGKDKETGEPQVDSYGNEKWMFQVEDQIPEGWMSVNRKAGSELRVGDYVYGIVDTWPEGKAKFVRQSPPEGTEYPKSEADSSTSSSARNAGANKATQGVGTTSDSELTSKVDYLITLVEQIAGKVGTQNVVDDYPIDLSEIPF